jgi:hypothetical protein
MKNFIISENEKKRILNLHIEANKKNYLFENEETSTVSNIKLPLSYIFQPGKYILTQPIIDEIKKNFEKIIQFVGQNKNKKIYLTIESSESQVTNYDTEVSPAIPLNKGDLAKKRTEQLTKILTNLIKKYKVDIVITQPKILIGNTKYVKGIDDPKDPKYKKEQYINIILFAEKTINSIKPITSDCLIGLDITLDYKRSYCYEEDNVTKKKDQSHCHQCDDALFYVYINDVLIHNKNGQNFISLNNGYDGGDVSTQLITIDKKLSNEIFNSTNENKVPIKLVCAIENKKCHIQSPKLTISKQNKIIFNDWPTSKLNDTETIIGYIDKCGNFYHS